MGTCIRQRVRQEGEMCMTSVRKNVWYSGILLSLDVWGLQDTSVLCGMLPIGGRTNLEVR